MCLRIFFNLPVGPKRFEAKPHVLETVCLLKHGAMLIWIDFLWNHEACDCINMFARMFQVPGRGSEL